MKRHLFGLSLLCGVVSCSPQKEIYQVCGIKNELVPENSYEISWFDPKDGKWFNGYTLDTDMDGALQLDNFPEGDRRSARDWALKIKLLQH